MQLLPSGKTKQNKTKINITYLNVFQFLPLLPPPRASEISDSDYGCDAN